MLLHARFPNEPFNAAVRDGTVGEKMRKVLAEMKAEAVYFTEYDGRRGAILVVNVDSPSQIPALAEPWFLTFHAEVKLHICMTPEDLGKAGLESLGEKWS